LDQTAERCAIARKYRMPFFTIESEEESARLRACSVLAGSLPRITPIKLAAPVSQDTIDAYLARLRVERPSKPTPEALDILTAAHLERIPYDNLDIHTGRPPPALDFASEVRRVAEGGRGGYCFTAVGAFASLLHSLGFVVSLHVGAVGPDPPPVERWGNHVVLIVHFEDGPSVVADCGLGEGPCHAFQLQEYKFDESGSLFAMEQREKAQGVEKWWFQNAPGHSFPGFAVDLSTSIASCEEFQAYHSMYWTHPESNYVKPGVVIHRPDMEGVLTLRGCALRRTHPNSGSRVLKIVDNRSDWFQLLEDAFHMDLHDLSEAERDHLWNRVSSDHSEWLSRKAAQQQAVP